VRRLSCHASIVLWSSCNECGHLPNFREKYIDFVMTQVRRFGFGFGFGFSFGFGFGFRIGFGFEKFFFFNCRRL
jgi:hypothetical protein